MGDIGIMGVHVPGMSWREMRDSAVLAEDLGYSCLTMGESWGEDAFTSLAQLAAVTSRIRIGTSIVPVFARSPANLAMTALNLDRMSEGRFFLGLGTQAEQRPLEPQASAVAEPWVPAERGRSARGR